MDAFRNGAAGVVSSAKLFRPEDFAELTTIMASRYRARASRPSAPLFGGFTSFDGAATPPLRGGEYSTFNISSIRSHLHRPPLQFKLTHYRLGLMLTPRSVAGPYNLNCSTNLQAIMAMWTASSSFTTT